MNTVKLCPFISSSDKAINCVEEGCGVYDVVNNACSLCSLPSIEAVLSDICTNYGCGEKNKEVLAK